MTKNPDDDPHSPSSGVPDAPLPGGADLALALAATIRQSVLVLDSDGRILFANASFYRSFGLDPERPGGRVLWELSRGEWHAASLEGAVRRALGDARAVEQVEMRGEPQQRGRRLFLATVRQLELAEHPGPLVMIVVDDLTERRRVERMLKRHMRQLQRSNRDLEEFAHAASHDLQEPLRKVRTFSNRLVDSLADTALTPRQRQYLERIQEAGARMQIRIDDLLRLARVARSRPELESLDLAAVVDGVLRDMESAMEASGGRVEVHDLPQVEADRSSMELLFQNLISNSIKYRRSGVPPEIRIRSDPISAPDGLGPEWIRLTVADNGIGFEQRYAERIFRPFERLHGRSEYDGSGVGLSICRRVVELHGGTIVATAAPGAGATFVIQLPTAQAEEEI